MVEILETLLALCGLAMVAYGIALFVALPAAGVFVAFAGVIIVHVALKRIERERTSREPKRRGSRARVAEDQRRRVATRSERVLATILFVTNLLVVSWVIPDARGHLGHDLGSLFRIVAALFFTGFTVSLFPTVRSLGVVVVATWAALFLWVIRPGATP